MDGIHDLGGMHGFGPVVREEGEPVFHAPWEGRVLAMMVLGLLRGLYTVDAFRHGIETMGPVRYLQAGYYERWRISVETLLVRAGVLTRDEIDTRVRALQAGEPGRRHAAALEAVPGPRDALEGGPASLDFVREVDAAPRFAAGQRVRARTMHPPGHTRLPRYARGRRGRIERVYPACVFPDTNAHGRGECPQYLYHVRFDGRELWGDDAEPGASAGLDLFESYLEPA